MRKHKALRMSHGCCGGLVLKHRRREAVLPPLKTLTGGTFLNSDSERRAV